MEKLIMTFRIIIDRSQISSLECPYGAVTMIPFTGSVQSELFSGEILPGGCDVQVENPALSRHLCAKYMFEGTDSAGNRCKLFVENNGYLTPDMRGGPWLPACPRFLTDSPVLGEYLSQPRFRSEVHGTGDGVDILVYDVIAEESFSNK